MEMRSVVELGLRVPVVRTSWAWCGRAQCLLDSNLCFIAKVHVFASVFNLLL